MQQETYATTRQFSRVIVIDFCSYVSKKKICN